MSGNTFGVIFKVTTFGESHGPAVGAVVDGCPPGIQLDQADIQKELDRRRPGQSEASTKRKEPDIVEILSGIFEGRTTGTPIALLIRNKDPDPSAYQKLKDVFRPGHADFTYLKKYGIRDYRGGGRASGRETAARVAAGAVAKEVLKNFGITVRAATMQVGNVRAEIFDEKTIEQNPMRCPDRTAAENMLELVRKAREEADSMGGIVEVRAKGVPPGLGEPVFGKLDAELAGAMMGIGAVKGVEIGDGFKVASRTGSENMDPFFRDGDKIRTKHNRAGGILGGISTGEDIILRLAVKPTSSIPKEQETVDISGKETKIKIEGRHDPCICPRLVPVAEAMTAIVLCDQILRHRGQCQEPD
jgi:chorismate synthase